MSDKCARCGGQNGRNFCVRCKRAVCDDCWNPAWSLCRECSSYKEGVRWDLTQILAQAMRTAEFASRQLNKCADCPILRDHLLYLLKTTKNIEYTAQIEGLFDEQHHAAEARRRLTDLAIWILIRQGMRADKDLWRRL